MAELEARRAREKTLGRRLKVYRHDVTDLATLAEVEEGAFDLIMCSNAFVLLDDPAAVIRGWRPYLKPDGVLAVDVTHEHNMRSGLMMEQVAARMGVYWPSNRFWIKSKDSFKEMLESERYEVGRVVEIEKISGERSTFYALDEADGQFDYIINTVLSMTAMDEETRVRARPIFKEEFAKAAVDGKVEIVDSLYLYLASPKH
jgi:SAM-dependent methyltransferase